MRAWPVHRPTHALATAIRIKRNPPSSFRNLRRKAGWPSHRSSGEFFHTHRSGQTRMPPQERRHEEKPKSLVLPVHRRHACLAGPPANTCSRNRPQNKHKNAPARTKTLNPSIPFAGRLARAQQAGDGQQEHGGQNPAHKNFNPIPQHEKPQNVKVKIQPIPAPSRRRKNLNPSCCRSTGGMRAWPVHRPTHAPATTLRINTKTPRPAQKP